MFSPSSNSGKKGSVIESMAKTKQLQKKIQLGERIGRLGYGWLILVPIGVLGFTFLVPLLSIVYTSFFGPLYAPEPFAIHGYEMLFSDYLGTLVETLKFAVVTTIATVVLSFPIAFFMRDASPLGRRIAIFLIVAPLMVNIIIRNYGWIILLSENGLLNNMLQTIGLIDSPLELVRNEIGVYIGLIHVFLPFTALPMYDVLTSLDSSIQEAARVHGAPRWKTFLFVTLPNMMPGIIAGGTIVFVITLGIYVTPVIMSGNTVVTLPMSIRQYTTALLDWKFVSASATVLVVIAAATVGLVSKYTGVTAWRDRA